MTDPVEAAMKHLEETTPGSYAHDAAVTAVYAAHAAREAAQPHDEGFVSAGPYRIAQPTPTLEPPPAPVIPLDLPETFAPYAADVTRAQAAAERVGLGLQMPAVLALIAGIGRHEATPTGADTETRVAMADRTMAALRQRHGEEKAEEIADAAGTAVKALGLSRVTSELGVENHLDLIDYLGGVWLRRPKENG